MDILEILGKIGFDWQVALANLVNFLIIFMIVKHFAFKPLRKVLLKRKETIQQGVDNAKQAQSELLMANRKAEEIEKEARFEAHTIVSDARSKTDELHAQAQAELEDMKHQQVQATQKQLEDMERSMMSEFQSKAVGLVIDATRSALHTSVDASVNEDIAKKALASQTV